MFYGYTRVSIQEQVNNTSLEDQKTRLNAAVPLVGGQRSLDVLFTDPGISGSIPFAERPAGSELLSVLEAGDTIIVTKLDRMFRNIQDALTTTELLKKQGVALILLDFGLSPVNTDNAMAALMFNMMAAFAEFERSMIKERVTAGRAARRREQIKAGDPAYTGGKAPFGWTLEGSRRDARLVPNPVEQNIITNMMILRHKDYYSYRQLHAFTKEVNHPIDPTHIRRILLRENQDEDPITKLNHIPALRVLLKKNQAK
jgi:DNA invertase Pin-like site-specific DNA recombinase